MNASKPAHLPLILGLLIPLAAGGADGDRTQLGPRTALDRYVARVDEHFSWKVVRQAPVSGGKFTVIELVSQQWLTTNEVDKPLWKHWLTVITPDMVDGSIGLLVIGGGSNDRPAPEKVDSTAALLATMSGSVVATLSQVPSQPLVFTGDGRPRKEDDLIAYTWDKFLRTGDDRWPARLPMTKAAVRALDAITAFCASEQGGRLKVDRFVVAGASKRGWTTWTTAAVDPRVVAIAPIVIDVLNVRRALVHHWETYGFWAPAIGSYSRIGLMDWDGTPEFDRLLAIEDPWTYRQRLTLPKFVINSSGDQFFPPESSQFYYEGLPGPKGLRYVPNTDHSLKGSDAWMSLLAFYQAVRRGSEIPALSWTSPGEGRLRVIAKARPTEARLWQATNEKARDFRLETVGEAWQSLPLEPVKGADHTYEATVAKPDKGWTAFFIELTFPSGTATPLKLTTEVRVVPESRPHKYRPPTRKPQ